MEEEEERREEKRVTPAELPDPFLRRAKPPRHPAVRERVRQNEKVERRPRLTSIRDDMRYDGDTKDDHDDDDDHDEEEEESLNLLRNEMVKVSPLTAIPAAAKATRKWRKRRHFSPANA